MSTRERSGWNRIIDCSLSAQHGPTETQDLCAGCCTRAMRSMQGSPLTAASAEPSPTPSLQLHRLGSSHARDGKGQRFKPLTTKAGPPLRHPDPGPPLHGHITRLLLWQGSFWAQEVTRPEDLGFHPALPPPGTQLQDGAVAAPARNQEVPKTPAGASLSRATSSSFPCTVPWGKTSMLQGAGTWEGYIPQTHGDEDSSTALMTDQVNRFPLELLASACPT